MNYLKPLSEYVLVKDVLRRWRGCRFYLGLKASHWRRLCKIIKKKNITGDTRQEEWILHNIMNIKTAQLFNNWTNHKTTFKSNFR